MKRLLILSAIFFQSLGLFANDGVFYSTGNTLMPVKETVVELRKEILKLTRTDKGMVVSVHFEFFNPGPEKEVIVGFVTPPAGGDVSEDEDQHPFIEDFTVVLNGRKLAYEIARIAESGYRISEDVGYENDFIYHFPVAFKQGMNIIEHTYIFQGGGSVEERYFYPYRWTTGKMWANGEIGDFRLEIDMGEREYFSVQNSFMKDEAPAAWKFEGNGKISSVCPNLYEDVNKQRMVMAGKGKLVLHVEHFQPDYDLMITGWQIFNEINFWACDQEKHGFSDMMDYFMPWGIEEEDLQKLDKSQLRLLRNYYFARHGYVFQSADLREFFDQFSWYLPDPSVAADESILTEHEREMLHLVQAEEKKRK